MALPQPSQGRELPTAYLQCRASLRLLSSVHGLRGPSHQWRLKDDSDALVISPRSTVASLRCPRPRVSSRGKTNWLYTEGNRTVMKFRLQVSAEQRNGI